MRPYQHVLDPLFAYIMIAEKQYEDKSYFGNYNIGPKPEDCVTTGEIADLFCSSWGDEAFWINISEKNASHEANFLKLDCSKIQNTFQWESLWNISDSVNKTVEWYKAYINKKDMFEVTINQIKRYMDMRK